MAWAPEVTKETVQVAVPLDNRTLLHSAVVPSLNVAGPVAAVGDTLAVNVTGWPRTLELADEVPSVVVSAWFTLNVCVTDGAAA